VSLVESLVTIVGLALLTLVTRAFFLLPRRAMPLPEWLQQGLRYAPLAALVAVVVPEVLLTQGQWAATWKDPRIYSALVAAGYYFWRRGILGTILSGTAVMLVLRLGLGW
jgi:branched-subunit amino acid transport protein